MPKTLTPAGLREEARIFHFWGMLQSLDMRCDEALEQTGIRFPEFYPHIKILRKQLNNGESIGASFIEIKNEFHPIVPDFLGTASNAGALDIGLLDLFHILTATANMLGAGVSQEKIDHVNFIRIVGKLLEMNLPTALTVSIAGENCLPSRYLAVQQSLVHGDSITDASAYAGCFDDMELLLLEVGAETGQLSHAFGMIAIIKERQAIIGATTETVHELIEYLTLSILIDSITLPSRGVIGAFAFLSKAARTSAQKSFFSEMAMSIKNGETLSEAMMQHPDHFKSHLTRMVHAGERDGCIEKAFHLICSYIARENLGIKIVSSGKFRIGKNLMIAA